MKIKMTTLAAGPAGVLRDGEVYDLPEVEAQALIDGGYAEAVAESAEPVVEEAASLDAEVLETADVPVAPVETAVKPRPRKKK